MHYVTQTATGTKNLSYGGRVMIHYTPSYFFTIIQIMFSLHKFLGLIIFLQVVSVYNLHGQKKKELTPEAIIDHYISIIGGQKWSSLKSRKEYSYVAYEKDKNSIIPEDSDDRLKIDQMPGLSIEVHKLSDVITNILVYKPECNWYYSDRSRIMKFFGPERIKFKTQFPRTELMEILNLEHLKTVHIEDTLYRVDFKDTRQHDSKQSLFFGINSGLLFKRAYIDKNEVKWEYHFSEYKESEGFREPYLIILKSNGNNYFTINVKSILYNVKIDPSVFDPPIPCKNRDDFKHLETSYKPIIN